MLRNTDNHKCYSCSHQLTCIFHNLENQFKVLMGVVVGDCEFYSEVSKYIESQCQNYSIKERG